MNPVTYFERRGKTGKIHENCCVQTWTQSAVCHTLFYYSRLYKSTCIVPSPSLIIEVNICSDTAFSLNRINSFQQNMYNDHPWFGIFFPENLKVAHRTVFIEFSLNIISKYLMTGPPRYCVTRFIQLQCSMSQNLSVRSQIHSPPSTDRGFNG